MPTYLVLFQKKRGVSLNIYLFQFDKFQVGCGMTKYKEFNEDKDDYEYEYDEEYKDLNWSSRHSLYQDSKLLHTGIFAQNSFQID